MDRVLASHVRTTVDELNKALDDADEEDDGALANDLVNTSGKEPFPKYTFLNL